MIREVSFGALAFPKAYSGQDNLQAASEVTKKLGINPNTFVFRTTNATTDGILFMFKTPESEIEAIKKAKTVGLKYVHDARPNEEIGKRTAKEILRTLGIV